MKLDPRPGFCAPLPFSRLLFVAQLWCLCCCLWFRLEKRTLTVVAQVLETSERGGSWSSDFGCSVMTPPLYLKLFHNPLKVVVIYVDGASFFCTRFFLPFNFKLMCLATGFWDIQLLWQWPFASYLLCSQCCLSSTQRLSSSAKPQLCCQLNLTDQLNALTPLCFELTI